MRCSYYDSLEVVKNGSNEMKKNTNAKACKVQFVLNLYPNKIFAETKKLIEELLL